MGVAKSLAERISASRYEDLPPQAIYWCNVAVAAACARLLGLLQFTHALEAAAITC